MVYYQRVLGTRSVLSLKRDLFTDVTKIFAILILFGTERKTLLHRSSNQTSFSEMSSFIKI